jgi:hypothetical protein
MAHDQEVKGSNPGTVKLMDVINLLAIALKEKLKIKYLRNQAKQVLRSTILSSTIVLVFFDNARIGRF